MNDLNHAFKTQKRVRGPWRRYLDALAPLRPDLHRYCCRLTGNVWDGEDLVQDTLIRVFSLLGKIDVQLQNPRAYLVRTATNLWIDRARRAAREKELMELAVQGEESVARDASLQPEVFDAATGLLQRLHPQERAAVVLNDVFDYSLAETAAILKTSVGAVKSALHRARSRIDEKLPAATTHTPSRQLVEAFMRALAAKDLPTLEKLCAADLSIEMVGGWESDSFEQSRSFFAHAHTEMPALGFGRKPRWELIEFEGEWMVLGLRTLNGREAVNEVHRIIENEGIVTRVRSYCFCPETLGVVAERLAKPVVRRPITHRAPSMSDVPRLLFRHIMTRHS
jgi:RNA polymerase sigma-70 factor (ECF subfamily)